MQGCDVTIYLSSISCRYPHKPAVFFLFLKLFYSAKMVTAIVQGRTHNYTGIHVYFNIGVKRTHAQLFGGSECESKLGSYAPAGF
jgi:hypothetical protein